MYKHRVQHVLGMANTHTQDFNCWGATKFIADPNTTHLEWVGKHDMQDWLMSNYEPIPRTNVREGDIVALFSGDKDHLELIHTAYCVERNRYVHKLGQNVARLETLQRVLKSYARSTQHYVFLRERSQICV